MQAFGTVVAPAHFNRVFPCDERSVGRCLEITKRFVPSRTAEARAGGTGKVDESRLFCSSNLRGECLTCGPRCSSCFVWGRTSSTCHLPCLCKSSCPWLRLRRRQIPSSCDDVSGRRSRQKACWTITGNKCSTFFFYRLSFGVWRYHPGHLHDDRIQARLDLRGQSRHPQGIQRRGGLSRLEVRHVGVGHSSSPKIALRQVQPVLRGCDIVEGLVVPSVGLGLLLRGTYLDQALRMLGGPDGHHRCMCSWVLHRLAFSQRSFLRRLLRSRHLLMTHAHITDGQDFKETS